MKCCLPFISLHALIRNIDTIKNVYFLPFETKTLEIKAWRDRQPKIVLNFRAAGLQGAGSGSI